MLTCSQLYRPWLYWPTSCGVDFGHGQKIGHGELARAIWQRWRPARLSRQVGSGVILQQADENLGDYEPTDWPEVKPVSKDIGLTQNVEPQRRTGGQSWLDVPDVG